MNMSPSQGDVSPDETAEHATATPKPFRFKHGHHGGNDEAQEDVGKRHRSRRHHHRSHKRRRMSNEEPTSLHPDVAFRESLFDALGDDEGAEFWQGVYGQPIHSYSRTYEDADTGELGTMDDEQYAQYVRRKMWERSAEGLAAAREAGRKEKKQEEEARRSERSRYTKEEEPAYNNFNFDFDLDASLRRGHERKEKKRWQQIWHEYLDRWKELQEIHEARKGSSADNVEQVFLRNKIAWPVESGKRKDVLPDCIESFIKHVSEVLQDSTKPAVLKAERIKWHPDKIQQRYGFMHIDSGTMEGVTAVFQVLDRMWNDLRSERQ